MPSRDWSILEDEATVADYFAMLESELRGERFNKAAHRRALQAALDDRSERAIESKHQNISAILIELGYPYIEGYKPLYNYQRLLRDVVVERVAERSDLRSELERHVDATATVPTVDDILQRLVDPPSLDADSSYGSRREARETSLARRASVNYLEREANNHSLGSAGEEFVINFERARLIAADRRHLADRVEHVSRTRGDQEGFDVLSFEESGDDRLIEVKTTAFGKQTPFFVSRNQVTVSSRRSDSYHLYRLFRFRADPHLFAVRGALERVCALDPVKYAAQVR